MIVVVEPLVLVGRVGTAEYTRYGNSRGADYSATQVEDLTRHVLVNSYCACIFYRYTKGGEGRRGRHDIAGYEMRSVNAKSLYDRSLEICQATVPVLTSRSKRAHQTLINH